MHVPVSPSFSQSVTGRVTLSLYLVRLVSFSLMGTECSANRSQLSDDLLRVHVHLSQVFLESLRSELLNVPGPGVTSNCGRHLQADGIFFSQLGGPSLLWPWQDTGALVFPSKAFPFTEAKMVRCHFP